MIEDFFKLSYINLRKRGLRSWLTIMGIIIGIGAVVALVSLSLGLSAEMERQFELFGSDKIFVMPRGMVSFGPSAGSATALTDEDAETVRKVSGIELVASMDVQQMLVRYGDESQFLNIIGISPDKETSQLFEEIQGFKVDKGRQLEVGDTYKITVGYNFANGDVFKKKVTVGDKFEIDDKTFKVIGIYEPIGNSQDDSQIYMSMESLRELTGNKEDVTAIFAKVKKGYSIESVKAEVEDELRDAKNQEEGEETFTVSTTEDIMRLVDQILGTIQTVLVGIGAISLIVGGVGVMNTMYTSVLERTKEIGIMKAIGAKNSEIVQLFLIESGTLGMVGGIFGAIFGIVMAKIVELYAVTALFIPLKAYVGADLFIAALVLAFAIGSIAGVLPARKAANLKPVDALRYE